MDYCKMFGNYSMTFNNSVKKTRNGFKHVCNWTLYHDNTPIHYGVNNAYYINRTWETYRFRTVMKQAVSELKQKLKNEIKEQYKKTHNLKHTGTKSKEAIKKLWNEDESVDAIVEIYMQL